MIIVGSVVALVVAIVLFIAATLVDDSGQDGKIKTRQACDAREHSRIASPTEFATNPCFEWDGEKCRHGDITTQGCKVRGTYTSKMLFYLSFTSLVVGIVLFFVPSRKELGLERHHRHRHHEHHEREY